MTKIEHKKGWDKRKGVRLTYSMIINGRKAYNLDRLAIYKAPFISQNDDGKDRREYNKWFKEEHGYTLKDFPDYELHHNIKGELMLVPYEMHRTGHAGSRSLHKALSLFYEVV